MHDLTAFVLLCGVGLWAYRQLRDLRPPPGGGASVVPAATIGQGQWEPVTSPAATACEPPGQVQSTPGTRLKAILLSVVLIAYVLSPIDVFPDALPLFGTLDDLVAMYFGLQQLNTWKSRR